jgi:MerR family transcriptional regulator, thiopeptide resistance regulator
MARYTVKQLARLSGVSVRALHHYDEIGLLKPAFIGENRYRYYGREELLRLQDILFHRELGVPLHEIASLLAHEGRDRVQILVEHRARLAERVERSRQLLQTIDRTIADLNGAEPNGAGIMKDKDLYKGFSPEKQAEYEDWLVDRFGGDMRERIEDNKAKVAALGPEGMTARMAEGEAAAVALANAFKAGAEPDDPANAPLLARHHAWIAAMWDRACPVQAYAGLADLYLAHPDFRTNFDKNGAGFTDWLVAAMKAYAGRAAA